MLLAPGAATAMPVLPQPVTYIIHGVIGYAVAAFLDKHQPQVNGVAAATAVGLAKEIHDVRSYGVFSWVDFFATSAGGMLYHYTKDMVRCPDTSGLATDLLVVRMEKRLEDCPADLEAVARLPEPAVHVILLADYVLIADNSAVSTPSAKYDLSQFKRLR